MQEAALEEKNRALDKVPQMIRKMCFHELSNHIHETGNIYATIREIEIKSRIHLHILLSLDPPVLQPTQSCAGCKVGPTFMDPNHSSPSFAYWACPSFASSNWG